MKIHASPKAHPGEVPCSGQDVEELCKALFELGYPRWQKGSLSTVLQHAHVRPYRAGETVIRQGDRSGEAFVVQRGRLRVELGTASGAPASVRMGPGDILGEIGLLHAMPRTATVKAEEDSRLYVLDRDAFGLLISASPDFRRRLEGLAHERQPYAHRRRTGG